MVRTFPPHPNPLPRRERVRVSSIQGERGWLFILLRDAYLLEGSLINLLEGRPVDVVGDDDDYGAPVIAHGLVVLVPVGVV